jgi:4-amino-4-deoxy-L-arabinose transferase-like glycosyltransferase
MHQVDNAALPASQARLIDAIAARPGRALAAFMAIHAALWTLLPALVCRNLPIDVIEGIVHGREWQIGYWKHPPLASWLDAAMLALAGPRPWAFFLLGQLAVLLCFWAVWRLARLIVSPIEALVAVVLLDGCIVFTLETIEFNENIVQLPVYALAAWSLWRGFTGKRVVDWALVGVWFAALVYAKYAAVVFILPLLLFSLVDRRARESWRTLGPYIAALIATALVLPHAIWIVRSDFSPFAFAAERAIQVGGLRLAWLTIVFIANAVALMALALVLLAALGGRPRARTTTPAPDAFARRYVAVLALGPLVTSVVLALLSGRALLSGWASQFWAFIGLFLVVYARPPTDRAALRRLAAAWSIVTLALLGVMTAAQLFNVGGGQRWATQFPGERFAAAVTEAWRRETGRPLPYVVGEFWLSGNLVLYSSDDPRFFHDATTARSPWIDPDDVRRRGGVIVWPADELGDSAVPAAWAAGLPGAVVQEALVMRQTTLRGERSWRIGWAILRPATP